MEKQACVTCVACDRGLSVPQRGPYARHARVRTHCSSQSCTVPLDGRGKRSSATTLALDERDKLLIEIARRFYGGLSARETAHRLRYRLLIYRNGRWRRTSPDWMCPHEAESMDAALWCLLRIRDHVPSEMTIRRALGYS
jgi:hypothetical protein